MQVEDKQETLKRGQRIDLTKPHKTVFQRTRRATSLLVAALAVSILVRVVPRVPGWVLELSLSVLAAVTVHLLDRLVLYRDTEEELEHALGKLKQDIELTVDELAERSNALTTSSLERIESGVAATIDNQTRSLVAETTSLDAMTKSGIVQIYPSRAHAAGDLLRDVKNQHITKIRIAGISLNDFALGQEEKLGEAWEAIGSYVASGRGPKATGAGLSIRILIIDPYCLGSALRSGAENREPRTTPGGLKQDVKNIADRMLQLVTTAREHCQDTNVTFECKLYRIPPILFLCLVDSVCYVEQYHFWSKRVVGTPIPVLKYRRNDDPTASYAMHAQMEKHFDWIWDNASIEVTKFMNEEWVGVDSGMYLCSARNVYTNAESALQRMVVLLRNAKEEVTIQGISLHSFFRTGELLAALEDLVREGKVRIRILFMDAKCEQAKLRSYREALFNNPSLNWSDYQSNPDLHAKSELSVDTEMAITTLRRTAQDMVQALRQEADWTLNLEAGIYTAAPHCFMLRADDSVLVEQYHYGKVVPGQRPGRRAILGKDMPVIEFTDEPPDRTLYPEMTPNEWRNTLLRRPFSLLKNHFEFVWGLAEKINLGDATEDT